MTPSRLRVVRRPAVETEGPIDETYALSPASLLDQPVAGALALALPLPLDPGGAHWEAPPPPLRLVPAEEHRDLDDAQFRPVRTDRRALPPPGPRAAVLVRALLEVLAGDRPVQQLMPWVSAEVLTQVEDLVCPSAPRPWAASLQRLLVSEPASGVAEVTAIVRRGARFAALALRLEGLDGRWQLTELQLG